MTDPTTPSPCKLSDLAGPFSKTPTLDPHPTANGRWQPTRAGAVNSWLWAREEFAYLNGNLALVGQNGSGKSLSSSVLCPTFIDGDVSAKALSAAAEAGGTLTTIHTLGRPGPPKSGAWWQEYGRTDPAGPDPATRWLTAGLWLHSAGGQRTSLERAWFLVPARVHAQIILERDGMPVTIDDLAAQLAAHDGLLFTSSTRLEQQCRDHASVLRKEDDYAEAVREQLYQPLDTTQTDALATVLRALRNVQAGDKISPRVMEETLTSALPALETRRIQNLADALSKAEQLRAHLQAAHTEHDILSGIRSAYRRYVAAAATTTATTYTALHALHTQAHTAHRTALREQDQAHEHREKTGSALREAEAQTERLEETVRRIRKRLDGHPGSNLTDLGDHAQEADERAVKSLAHADEARTAFRQHQDRHRADGQAAETAMAAWTGITSRLGVLARDLRAEAFHQPLAAALTGTLHHDSDTAQAAREPAAIWARAQAEAAENVHSALNHLARQQESHLEAQDLYEGKRQHAAEAADRSQEATETLEQAEDTAREALARYSRQLKRLPPLPPELCNATPLDPTVIRAWTDDQTTGILAGLDIRAREERSAHRSRTADQAQARTDEAAELAQEAMRQARRMADTLTAKAGILTDAPASLHTLADASRTAGTQTHADIHDTGEQEPLLLDSLEQTAHHDLTQRQLLLQHAARDLAAATHAQGQAITALTQARNTQTAALTAQQTARTRRSSADQQAHIWARDVHTWAGGLKVLDTSRLRLPRLTDTAPDLTAAHHLAQDTAAAHRRAVESLTGRLAKAELRLKADHAHLEDLDAQIRQARTTSPPPATADWRASRHGRPGAPLWQVVEFAPHLTPEEAGALEGALLAAGLLDAWVSPTGELVSGDTTLLPTAECHGPTLADVLQPDAHTPLAKTLVHRLLAGIPLLKPGQKPDPGQTAVCLDGTAYLGPLSAASPTAWNARHIGSAARERARLQRLAELKEKREHATTALAASQKLVDQLNSSLALADQEQTSPDPTPWHRAEEAATTSALEAELKTAAAADAEKTAEAAEEHRKAATRTARSACDNARIPTDQQAADDMHNLCNELTGHIGGAATAARTAHTATRALRQTREHAAQARAQAAQAEEELTAARQAAAETEQDRNDLPRELDLVPTAQEAAARAHQQAQEAAYRAHDAEEALSRQTSRLADAKAAAAAQARRAPVELPVKTEDLTRYRDNLRTFTATLDEWTAAALQAHFTARTAASSLQHADTAQQQLERLVRRSTDDQQAARQARHRFDEETRQHGRPYQEMSAELESRLGEQRDAHTHLDKTRKAREDAHINHLRKQDATRACEERLRTAADNRKAGLARLQELFDHGLVAEMADSETLHRPEQPGEALEIATALMQQRGIEKTPDRNQAAEAESKARAQLDGRIRHEVSRLLQINRHVTAEDIPGTTWRRITVTQLGHTGEAGTTRNLTQSLKEILAGLTRIITRLESDFNEQVQNEVKGVVFSELRRDINRRIDMATRIVNDITTTLDGVRTGVARVGIRLSWKPKDDPIAREALRLVQAADLTGNFDRMYDFFIELLKSEEGAHPTWAKKVESAFDYRNWFAWEIALTHKEFRDDPSSDTEAFRTLTPRSNPLATLSGGEKRLVTMLPLLAAAHAFYSTEGYTGPRMIFIDELNATLDSKNLRKLLELLRTWQFDAIFTLPSKLPLLVSEAAGIAIHHIHKTDTARYSIPSIWTGSGTPRTVRIQTDVPAPRSHQTPQTETST
ncbi:SbcC/MukB-like Walker B domain-containing protein [Streptomyces roseolus]|uniref:SbcC/MukB-like Walker B domain-containing protein n=1 Tax=Streptomyces roseolus TaxID=67358 RepID=UPI00368ED3C6